MKKYIIRINLEHEIKVEKGEDIVATWEEEVTADNNTLLNTIIDEAEIIDANQRSCIKCGKHIIIQEYNDTEGMCYHCYNERKSIIAREKLKEQKTKTK